MMEEMDDNEVVRSIRPTSDFTLDADGKLTIPAPAPLAYIKKAILSKKGMGKMIRPWVLRTVVLDRNHNLLYYDGNKLRGEISLSGTIARHVEADLADGRPFAFEIANISGVKKHQNSSLLLAASCQQDAKDWVDCLMIAASTPSLKSNDVTGYTTFEVNLCISPFCVF